jgi:hypothetical protein
MKDLGGSSSGGGGTTAPAYASRNAPCTLTSSDEYVNITSTGVVTLPSPTARKVLHVRKRFTGVDPVTFNVTIDGEAVSLLADKESVHLLWTGSSWENWG